MMAPATVRQIAESDFAEWLALWDGYNAFYGRSGDTALPRVVTDVTWARLNSADEPMFGLVAVQDNKLVGLVHYLFHRSTISIPPVCYLQDLFTADAARGRGVGRVLVERVYEEALVRGSNRVYWQTHETNTTAQLLYDKLAERSGFVVYRRNL